jgi:SAM-dependent methyltransferase
MATPRPWHNVAPVPPDPKHATAVERLEALLREGPRARTEGTRPARTLRAALLRLARPHLERRSEIDAALLEIARSAADDLRRVEAHEQERWQGLDQWKRDVEKWIGVVDPRIHRAQSDADDLRRDLDPLAEALNALPYAEGQAFRWSSRPVIGRALELVAESKNAEGYVAFEDLFRGAEERVAATQREYLALLDGHAPVLDIGCGRGEMLQLLAAAGIEARGVDTDGGMVERCVARGVNAVEADAVEHLAGLEDGSLGAIFSAQVIEHIPYPALSELLGLAARKLRPGGLFIAETVNPHRIASLKTFWVDPTHQHPLFPETTLALCGIAGFRDACVFAPGSDDFEAAMFTAPAYAVVATVG